MRHPVIITLIVIAIFTIGFFMGVVATNDRYHWACPEVVVCEEMPEPIECPTYKPVNCVDRVVSDMIKTKSDQKRLTEALK